MSNFATYTQSKEITFDQAKEILNSIDPQGYEIGWIERHTITLIKGGDTGLKMIQIDQQHFTPDNLKRLTQEHQPRTTTYTLNSTLEQARKSISAAKQSIKDYALSNPQEIMDTLNKEIEARGLNNLSFSFQGKSLYNLQPLIDDKGSLVVCYTLSTQSKTRYYMQISNISKDSVYGDNLLDFLLNTIL
jgi:hypothetical protein